MRIQPILIAALSFCSLTCSLTPALAQAPEAAATDSVASKSTCSSGACDAKSGGAASLGKRMHKGKHGARAKSGAHQGRAMAAVKAIKSLPSLTADQSKQIDTILSAFKEEIKPLRLQAKALREQGKAAPEGGAESTSKAQLTEIKQQFRSKAKETMQKVLAVLTPEQRVELKAKRKAQAPAKAES